MMISVIAFKRVFILPGLVMLLVISGCAGQQAFNSGLTAFQQSDYERSVNHFLEASRLDPEKGEYRMYLYNARTRAALQHLQAARKLRDGQQPTQAMEAYRQALTYDPTLQIARNELEGLLEQEGIAGRLQQAREQLEQQQYEQARQTAEALLNLNPELTEAVEIIAATEQKLSAGYRPSALDIDSAKPISIELRNTDIREGFGILGRMTGLQFIFDKDLKAKPINLKLQQVTTAQALEAMLTIHQLKAKQLNRATYLIYEANRNKEQLYEEQMIRTYFLSQLPAKEGMALVRSILKPKNIAVNEQSNSLVIRDVPEMLELADKLLQSADRGDSEVMFELELIEVSHSDTLLLGPSLSSYSISGGLAQNGTVIASSLTSGGSAANLLTSFNNTEGVFTLPTATFDFTKTLTDTEILASPKIRVKNREKAKVHVGTREPVITTTTSGDNVSENVQYVDVGVKLDIEPTIQLDGTISTKVSLEVSNVIKQIETNSGTLALSISTTNAESTLVLQDGERTVIGGLIRDDNTKTRKTIPILGDLPLLGKLFTNHDRKLNKREILLSITPHIVRNIELPGAELTQLLSGGESNPRAGGSLASFEQEIPPADDAGEERVDDQPDISNDEQVETEEIPVAPRRPRPRRNDADNASENE